MTKKIAGVKRYKITETDRTPPSEFERLLNAAISNTNMAAQDLGNISSEDPRVERTQSMLMQIQSTLEDLLVQQQPVQRPPNPETAINAYKKQSIGESKKMKISKATLGHIIKEELDHVMQEMHYGDSQMIYDEDMYQEEDTMLEEETLDEGNMMDKAIEVAKRYGVPYKAALAILAAAGIGAAGGAAVDKYQRGPESGDVVVSADDQIDPEMIYSQYQDLAAGLEGDAKARKEQAIMAAAQKAAKFGGRSDRRDVMDAELGLREGKSTKDQLTKMIMEELSKLTKA
jgi:hypothetical protein